MTQRQVQHPCHRPQRPIQAHLHSMLIQNVLRTKKSRCSKDERSFLYPRVGIKKNALSLHMRMLHASDGTVHMRLIVHS